MGVVIAVIAVIISQVPKYLEIHYPADWLGQVVSGLVFAGLVWFLYRVAAASRRT
jgi:hypothetical protein